MTYRETVFKAWLNRPFPMDRSDYPDREKLDRENWHDRKAANG